MEIKNNLTNSNYNEGRLKSLKYIVIHYTGNNGDSAWGNTNYFKNAYRGASAHYFVDEEEIYRCVQDEDTAWHCGDTTYCHQFCRNSNSIGIELCSRKDGDYFYFKQETIENALWLVRQLMAKYNIPIENVLRHFDVTGKACPAPFVPQTEWENFKRRLQNNYPIDYENIQAMVELGVISSPDYWRNKTNVQWLNELLASAAADGVCCKEINNNVQDIDAALKILVEAGVISSPDYWQNAVARKIDKYLEILLIGIANKCLIS